MINSKSDYFQLLLMTQCVFFSFYDVYPSSPLLLLLLLPLTINSDYFSSTAIVAAAVSLLPLILTISLLLPLPLTINS